MALTLYERDVQREVERWQSGDDSWLRQLMNAAMTPVDWVAEQVVSAETLEQFDDIVGKFFATLGDVSKWTFSDEQMLRSARNIGIEVGDTAQLRQLDLQQLDELAKTQFNQNAVLAAIQGGGTGLGGIVLLAADIPLLFTINLRLIQQVSAAYGFSLRSPDFQPLVLSAFNAAASGSSQARHQALREVAVAASALAHEHPYNGNVRGTFNAQNRHLPREIAKNLLGRKLAQAIPVAGAAVGAGVNYWFTKQTAETAYMLFRSLHVECKDRR
jgi:hypothetical protein